MAEWLGKCPFSMSHFQVESVHRYTSGRARHLVALTMSIVATLIGPAGAGASTVPGTPVPVEPGVPGNGRAWELVTPPDTADVQIFFPAAIAASGNALFYDTFGPLPGASAEETLGFFNISRRTPDGWTSSTVARPYPDPDSYLSLAGPNALTPDLSEVIWTNDLPLAAPEAPRERGIFRGTLDGHFSLLVSGIEEDSFRGASTDLQHVLFTTEKHLLAGDSTRTEGKSLYEIVGSTLRLVDVGPGGSVLSDCGSAVTTGNPISRDGRRIFFQTAPSCSGPQRAYLREDGLTTTLISASECTLADCGEEANVTLVGATPSGSRAFFVTGQKLTDDDADATADLYRYDVASGHLTLLSAMPGEVDATVRVSDDGSRALFWVTSEGKKSLYLATPGGPRLISASAEAFLQLSPSGRYALFATKEGLAEGDADESVDVYRYDAETQTLTRISTGPVGGNGAFDATISSPFPGSEPASSHPYRAMSDDGTDVFFGTSERLLPEDHNEVGDVYEWKEGSLALVSAGGGDRPSTYMGTTPDGNSAIFRTTLTLLPADRDGGDLDFYAARVGGGFPEPPPAASCQDDACLPPLHGRIDRSLPGSAVPHGGGIRVREPSAQARRRMASSGRIVLLVEVPDSGRLFAQARARVGHRQRVVASTSLEVARPGAVRLGMRLSSEARQALAVGHDLQVQVALRLPPLRTVRQFGFVLGGDR
jgi:hypothetical protein